MRHGYGVTEKALTDLIERVVRARADDAVVLLSALQSRPLPGEHREAVRELLADELVGNGLNADGEPNEHGHVVEAAIDWLGHQ